MHRQALMFALLTVAFSSVAHAQFATPTTRKLDITLIGGDCERLPKNILVVYDNLDREPESAVQDPQNKCHYTVEKLSGDGFTIGQTLFSLRLRSARTDCRVATEIPDKVPPYRPIGVLKFPFELDTAQDLTISTDPATFVVSYVRLYRRDSTLQDSRACRELATFEGREILEDVTFDRETIYFVLVGERAQIIVDEDILQEIRRNAKKRQPASLSPSALGEAYKRQTAKGQLPDATLHASANEADTLAKRLREKQLKNMTLKQE